MYHYITLGSSKIYMTGLGILAFVIVFLLVVYIKTKKYHLSPQFLWKNIPFYLLFTYLLSTYLYYLIESHIFIPLSVEQLLLYLSPYGYHFHFIGIVMGILLSGIHFIKTIESENKKEKRLHIFFSALISACIVLGIFLLLGDNFIGLSTESLLYVSAIKDDSNMAIYGKVLPLGLFLSLLSLFGLILYLSRRKKNKNIAYGGFAMFTFFLAVLLLFQQYPRHLVINIRSVTFDIKQYLLLFLTIIFLKKQYDKRNILSGNEKILHEENNEERERKEILEDEEMKEILEDEEMKEEIVK